MNTPTVFVTGATGLLGSHLLYDLLQKGYYVRALKRRQSNVQQVREIFDLYSNANGDADALFRQIEWVNDVELSGFQSMSEAVDGCIQVYHAAATVSFNAADRAEMMRVNAGGTANIVNVCLDRNIPLCYVSSIAALGRSETGELITETDIWQTSRGRSAYSYSKYRAETEVWRGIAEGLQAVIVNPAVILGAGNHSKGSSRFFAQVHKGLRFHTPGVTAFVDVRDVCRCMIQLMTQQRFGERFILAAGNMSYRELFNMIADGFGTKRPSIAARPWMLNIACRAANIAAIITGRKPALTNETAHSAFQQIRYSNEKIKTALHYEFIPLEQTIADCCKYFSPANSARACDTTN